ncbi:hypothetical protein C2S53_017711 [Perilla frutescens var. hirtella]|uniref:Pectinesterase n=1 Tax=Perilla frutescens var. hirtella TaxID=608512 RepID=A0AAD4ISG8_PERFH|nr:hypothetical protein C2S53_017711 [Perilla frutescens var. hirtella]
MAGEWGSKKKAVIAGVASILLVAAIIAVAIGTTKSDNSGGSGGIPDVESTTKAVDAICAPTQYKETCQNSLVGANTTDPKKLIETAIDVTVKSIGGVLEKSSLLKEVANDPMTKGAFEVCKEVLEKAVDDLRRSVDKVGEFDAAKAKEYIGDLRTWLSAVVTNQETCVDAFENTTGDTGEKMKNLLKTARELSSNGLAMVTDISEAVGSLPLEHADGSRKLLSEEEEGFVNRRLLEATTLSLKPTIEVAKDGSGKFKSINEALATLPKKNNESFIVIHIKAGVYNENIDIPKGLNKLVFVGDGPKSTIITGDKSMAGGVQTYYTATLAVNGQDFLAKDIGVENTAGPNGNQSLAVRVSGDRAIFYNVVMDGYQDTLCADTHRQFYRNCTISGTVDFVFGNGLALFQDCTFVVRKPGPKQACMVTAQGRSDANSNSAIIIQNGHFKADPALLAAQPPVTSFLGRPWKEMARTIIMQSDIEGFINPTGWAPWVGNVGLDTCYYVEHNNRGPGAKTTGRAKWKGIRHLTPEQVQSWTGRAVYGGDGWIAKSGVPYAPTMMQV